GQFEAARGVFAELGDLARACRSDAMQMHAELGMGEAELGLRQFDAARRRLGAALAAGRAAEDALVECRALHGLAAVELHLDHFPQAMALDKEALGVLPRLGDAEPLLAGEISLHLGTVLGRMGHVDEAVGECRTLTDLARCYVMCGDRQLAAEYAARAIARSRDVGQPDEEARTRIVLGILAAERGDIPAAEQEMLAAAQRCRRSGMMPELVTIYHALGRLAGRQGQYKEAT